MGSAQGHEYFRHSPDWTIQLQMNWSKLVCTQFTKIKCNKIMDIIKLSFLECILNLAMILKEYSPIEDQE